MRWDNWRRLIGFPYKALVTQMHFFVTSDLISKTNTYLIPCLYNYNDTTRFNHIWMIAPAQIHEMMF